MFPKWKYQAVSYTHLDVYKRQTLYNITDMAWIGLLGSKAVAGVGVGGMFTWFSQGLASMLRMGDVYKRQK